jgi:hypothetical protein
MKDFPHHHKHKHKILLFPVIFIFILLLGIRLMPWDRVNWGKVEMLPGSAITVTGEAKQDVASQIAHFTAAVTLTDQDKQTAVNQVNQSMDQVIETIKDFGIPDQDIQTQSVSVNQYQEPRTRIKKWRATNSVEIVLRQVDQASALTDLLSETSATDVSGPRFTLDDTQQAEVDLMEAAIDNAREKAEAIAKASDRKLGKVLTVSEGQARPGPILRTMEAGIGAGAPVEPGTETVYKTVSVTFELK